jgi:nucleoside-diphosphate-sugar epimerase
LVSRSERVLLTGSGGFTGRPLAARLRQDGHEVFGITRTPPQRNETQGDLCDPDFVDRVVRQLCPTVVIHLAAIASPLHGNLGELYAVNVGSTANLLNALAELTERPRRVIVASSATVYAPPKDATPLTEDSPLRPQSHYGASKRAMEDVARLFADRLPILITRPFNYTGHGQEPVFLVPKLVDHFVRRAPSISLGNLELLRDFSDIGRVIEVYARLVSQPIEHPVVNICSGRAIHLGSILGLLREISGHSIEVVKDPALVRPGEPRTIQGSALRLESMLGDLPNPDFRDTLQSMYESRR